MPVSATIRKSLYKDSVALMRIEEAIRVRPAIQQATLVMGTPANKAMLAEAGLMRPDLESARPGDLIIVVAAETAEALDSAHAACLRLLEGEPSVSEGGGATELAPRSIAMAETPATDARLAQISVPGPYAAAEALKALRRGLHVFLFSDNVPVAQELALKRVARERGLLVMGPDCGTALIGGVPVGFANVVRPGRISLVGASGTGLQQVACQIHALGHGVRHAIGTGGRDLTDAIGGITTGQALDLLEADAGTDVIVIVSKPPAPGVARRVLERASTLDKPLVVLFLGANLSGEKLAERVVVVDTLHDAAAAAVALVEGRRFERAAHDPDLQRTAEAEARNLAPGQRELRGLYSGGTFCTEAQLVWRGLGLQVQSNAQLDDNAPVAGHRLATHLALDLGSDEFTVGRPHPMIDPATRIARISEEARDPATAAIVLDVVLGYAGHADPAGALAPAIATARAACTRDGRHLAVIAFVCGTEEDPQRLSTQQSRLRAAGAIVVTNSTAAARLAGEIALRAQAHARRSLVAHG